MIPHRIVQYLMENHVPFKRHWHTRAVSGQELAATLHVTGYRVAKSVIVEADGAPYIAVLPAAEMLDEALFARAVGAADVRLLPEERFAPYFPDCEVGAEPPFGGLFGLPVVLDERLAGDQLVVFRAGSHEETLEIRGDDFYALESPITAPIGRPFSEGREIHAP
ncbi:MAG: YbaK/EbsC family protein [Deltaproteobacteria bacterium]|nr:YbaK/EbsC family protein [Deltaproteobacteria bacterium]